jgi:quercetin dioxygenase-like cupin family protein
MPEAEVIAKTDEVSVRVMTLGAHQATDWHYHTQVTDNIFCLTGDMAVHLQDPGDDVRLAPGQRCKIEKGRIHQVENCGGDQAAYLLVQGIGPYDFNVVSQGSDSLTLFTN